MIKKHTLASLEEFVDFRIDMSQFFSAAEWDATEYIVMEPESYPAVATYYLYWDTRAEAQIIEVTYVYLEDFT